MQRPRLLRLPDRIATSAGQEAAELAASAGLTLDDWQRFVLDVGLSERTDGRWSAFEVGLIVPRQNGKGDLGVDTPILTTDGWETMGSIRTGQFVYGGDGSPTRVVACSEVFTDHECYEIEFTDGSLFVAGGDHLWHVRDRDGRWSNRSTAYLSTRFGRRRSDNGRMEYNFRVRCDVGPDTPDADLPIDPYLFGFWLGDGTHTASTITVGHDEKAWVAARIELAGAEVLSITPHDHGNAVGIRFRLPAKMRDGFESRARRLGVWGNKHIPEVYLSASMKQRRALLAGLMDSDGSISLTNRSPQVEFATSFPALACGFHRLARSLGIRVTPKVGKTSFAGKRHRDRIRFLWTPQFDPFEMPRKSERFVTPVSDRQSFMSVVNVRRVATVPTRCIQVTRRDGVYLAGQLFTPTHNSILEARELAGLFLFDERLILHSAHEFKTANEAFLRVRSLIENTPDLMRKVKQIRQANEVSIETKTGARLMFVARSRGSGRGFSGDCVILDEAYNLGAEAMGALLPTLSARPNPQIWYTSSAPMEGSSQLHAVRRRAMAGGSERLAFLEWSIDPDTDSPDEVRSWAKANPAFGIRISEEFVRAEHDAMPPAEFARERLGVPDPEPVADPPLFPLAEWNKLADPSSEYGGKIAFAVDVAPGAAAAAIAMVAIRPDGLPHVELVDHRPGVDWLPARRAELDKHRPKCWVRDPSGPAVELAGKFRDLKAREATEASTRLVTAVGGGGFRWLCDERLHPAVVNAVVGARRKDMGDGVWKWSRAGSDVDISPLVAMTWALWAAPIVARAKRAKPIML